MPNDTPAGTQRARAKILPRGGENLSERHTGRHTPYGTLRARAKILPRNGENLSERHTGRHTVQYTKDIFPRGDENFPNDTLAD